MHAVLFSKATLSIDELSERVSLAAKSCDGVQGVKQEESSLKLLWEENGYGILLRLVTGAEVDRIIGELDNHTGLSDQVAGSKSAIVLIEDELPANCSDAVFNALVCLYDYLHTVFPSDPIFDCRNARFLEMDPVAPELAKLIELATNPDPEERATAADELGRCNDPVGHRVLLQLGADSDPGVRMMVAIALMCAEPTPPGGRELLETLKNDSDPDVREQAESAIDCLS